MTAEHDFEVFYDGDCPLCLREINMLSRLDRRSRLKFTDIAAPSFDAVATTGRSWQELMDEIHGRLPDGTMVTGVEVFRQLYGAVGLGFVLAPTRWPLIGRLADAAYTQFARNRLKLTGRCTDETCALPVSEVATS